MDKPALMPDTTETQTKGPEPAELLALPPLCLGPGQVIDFRAEVEWALSGIFYDLAALEPKDAEAYARMRVLALERYGLTIMDGHLPRGALDNGLDVIDIMRNIHLFAAQYTYNLHQQLFILAAKKNEVKVRAISVDHLTASIRRHGAGVINTTINYTYGFLKKRLEVITPSWHG